MDSDFHSDRKTMEKYIKSICNSSYLHKRSDKLETQD